MRRSEKIRRYNELFTDSLEALRSLKGRFDGQRVYCVGCGPSLIKQPLGALDGCPVISTNWAHLALDGVVSPSWSCSAITDSRRMVELRDVLVNRGQPVFCSPCIWTVGGRVKVEASVDPELYSEPFICIKPKPKRKGIVNYGCSLDLEQGVYLGRSVIFTAIQIAAYLGASEIVCLGMDMNYSGARTYFDNRISSGNLYGFRYHKHAKPVLIAMRDILEKAGVKLLNGTNGGAVDCLQKIKI